MRRELAKGVSNSCTRPCRGPNTEPSKCVANVNSVASSSAGSLYGRNPCCPGGCMVTKEARWKLTVPPYTAVLCTWKATKSTESRLHCLRPWRHVVIESYGGNNLASWRELQHAALFRIRLQDSCHLAGICEFRKLTLVLDAGQRTC